MFWSNLVFDLLFHYSVIIRQQCFCLYLENIWEVKWALLILCPQHKFRSFKMHNYNKKLYFLNIARTLRHNIFSSKKNIKSWNLFKYRILHYFRDKLIPVAKSLIVKLFYPELKQKTQYKLMSLSFWLQYLVLVSAIQSTHPYLRKTIVVSAPLCILFLCDCTKAKSANAVPQELPVVQVRKDTVCPNLA